MDLFSPKLQLLGNDAFVEYSLVTVSYSFIWAVQRSEHTVIETATVEFAGKLLYMHSERAFPLYKDPMYSRCSIHELYMTLCVLSIKLFRRYSNIILFVAVHVPVSMDALQLAKIAKMQKFIDTTF